MYSEDEYMSDDDSDEEILGYSDYSDGISEDDEYEDDLPEEDVSDKRNEQHQDITQVSDTLSIPRVWARILLRHYNWDVAKAQDAWLTDEEKVRKDVGLVENQVEVPESTSKCRVCLDGFPINVMCAATCGHLFCNSCWTQLVTIKIRCPDPSCAVSEDMVNELVPDENKEKDSRCLDRFNVEDKKQIKRCPAPGCELAVEVVVCSSSYDVVCRCGHGFCWNCLEDAHRPVDCGTVHKWAVKNSAESESIAWILANCKSCPKCRQPIQKDEGCMRMTCSCRFQFCWVCLGDWKTHGNYGSECNVYERAKAEGRYDVVEEIKKKVRYYSDTYTFFYGRFLENHKSWLKAVERLQEMKVYDLAKLSDRYSLTIKQLEFITDAWLQIIEGRRVLKWTSAYGYYLPTSDHSKQKLFGCLQDEAESWLERLHQCAEVELQTYLYLKEDDAPEKFNSFRLKLLELTKFTGTCLENLIRAVENGLQA